MRDPLYQHFRDQFLAHARQKKLDLISYEHPDVDPQGKKLYTDYAVFQGEKSQPTLIHISGLHGVEGYFGSLLQSKILESFDFNAQKASVIFVHAVNPFGMAYFRRTNAANVDLNRNCWPDGPTYNSDFLKLEALLSALKEQGPLGQSRQWIQFLPTLLRWGFKRTLETITGGQGVAPQSIFYAGDVLQPELQSLLAHLQRLTRKEDRLRVIDVHTGLGAFAQESLIVNGVHSQEEASFWSKIFATKIIDPATDPRMYEADGVLAFLFQRHWPQSCHIVQEFGTYSGLKVLKALLRENSSQMKEVFFPDNSQWLEACLQKGRQRFIQLACSDC
jgi:hypothetical protein